METFKSIAKLLLEEKPLSKKHKDHKLSESFNKHQRMSYKTGLVVNILL